MENKNLNLNDGWERIVNSNAVMRASARERVAARKRERRLKKLFAYACVSAIACVASAILVLIGFGNRWLGIFAALVCMDAASFLYGRYVEAKSANKKGE